MLDDFLVRAVVGGIGVAAIAGLLGCFVVWRRMAYFGNALAHSALLGVGLGALLAVDLTASTVGVCLLLALSLVLLELSRGLASDTILGILAHASLALGLIALSFMETLRVDLMAYLFGDVLAVTRSDLVWIWGGGALVHRRVAGHVVVAPSGHARRGARERRGRTDATRTGSSSCC